VETDRGGTKIEFFFSALYQVPAPRLLLQNGNGRCGFPGVVPDDGIECRYS